MAIKRSNDNLTSINQPNVKLSATCKALDRCTKVKFSSGSRPGHKVSGTQSKFPNFIENGQNISFSRGFSDSEPSQNFV